MVHFAVVGGWLVAGWWFEGQGVMMDDEVATAAGMDVRNNNIISLPRAREVCDLVALGLWDGRVGGLGA
jgi:hypothetical protein